MSDIDFLKKNFTKIPQGYLSTTNDGLPIVWLIDRQKPSVEADYSFDEERIGITYRGEFIWGFDSGCSCPTPWGETADAQQYKIEEKTWKEFVVSAKDFDVNWKEEAEKKASEIRKAMEGMRDGSKS